MIKNITFNVWGGSIDSQRQVIHMNWTLHERKHPTLKCSSSCLLHFFKVLSTTVTLVNKKKSQKREIFTMMCRTYLAAPRYTPTLQVPILHSYALLTFGGWVPGNKEWAVALWLHYDFGVHMNMLERPHCWSHTPGVQPRNYLFVFTTELMSVSANYFTSPTH